MAKPTSREIEVFASAVDPLSELLGVLSPRFASLAKALLVAQERSKIARLEVLFRVLDDGDEPSHDLGAVEDEEWQACCERMLRDDESDKAWFFAALARSFRAGEVPEKRTRLQFLRFASAVSSDDLADLEKVSIDIANHIAAHTSAVNVSKPQADGIRIPQLTMESPAVQALASIGLVVFSTNKVATTRARSGHLHQLMVIVRRSAVYRARITKE